MSTGTFYVLNKLARYIERQLPKDIGFTLIVWQKNEPGVSSYISNGLREDNVEALRETADRLELRKDWKPGMGPEAFGNN